MGNVQKFLDINLEHKDSLSLESFSFTMPKIVEETISNISVWKKKAKRHYKPNASGSKNYL
jgi:hypothetical protein